MKNTTLKTLQIGKLSIESVIEDEEMFYNLKIEGTNIFLSPEEMEEVLCFTEESECDFKKLKEEYEEERLLQEWFDSDEGVKDYEMERRYEYNDWLRTR